MYKITKARKEDAEEIALLNKQFHLDIPNFYWNSKKWVYSEIEKGNFYTLIDNKSILGAIDIEKDKEEYSISTIAVKEDMHGKNLGKRLIEFAKKKAIKEKIPLLTVESFVDYNLEGFYTKCGFTKNDKLGKYKGHNYFKFFMKL